MTTTKKPTAASLAIIIDAQAATIESLGGSITALQEAVLQLQATLRDERAKPHRAKGNGQRDYGPSSTRKMTDIDAWRILYGDLAGQKARPLADHLGLSRGQVYSVLGGYTFNHILPDSFTPSQREPLLLEAE